MSDEDITFDYFEELNRKYPTVETFNLNWKCNWFFDDIRASTITFENVKNFNLVLEDK